MSAVVATENYYKLCAAFRSGRELQRTWVQPKLEQRGLSQAALGRQLSVQPSQIASWLNDRESIPPQHRLRLSEVLALSAEEVLDLNYIAESTARLREWARLFQKRKSRAKPDRRPPYRFYRCFHHPSAIFDRFRAYAADYIEADATTTKTPCARVIYLHVDAAHRSSRDLSNYLTHEASTLFDDKNVWVHRYYPHHLYLGFFLVELSDKDGPGVIELQRQITRGLEVCAGLINSRSEAEAKSAQQAVFLLSRYGRAHHHTSRGLTTFGNHQRPDGGAAEELLRLTSLASDAADCGEGSAVRVDDLSRFLESLADENPSARHVACMHAWNILRQLDTHASSCPALLACVAEYRETIEQFRAEGALETNVQQLLFSLIRLHRLRGEV